MPVTAKLSKSFYNKLGDEVANELVEWFNSVDATYRSDLREMNELNFARFDAKLEQRLAELGAGLRGELRTEVGTLRTEIGTLRTEIGELRTEIAGLRAELIKWSFVFFATAALAVIGLR